MKTVISVRFRTGGKNYYFSPGTKTVFEGDGVIVETSCGTEFGDVVEGPKEIPDEQVVAPLKEIVRVASETDREQRERNIKKEKEAFDVCVGKIADHKLDMKLVSVEYAFNGSKVVFYFTADGRVDFRELVKDLAGVFKTRIELRQIGVRDEAKMLGGLGSCGRPVCCKSFLADFIPVSIKMAKEQNLSLSPTKISGICGRLMCCLKYEQDCYESMRRQMPRVGAGVMTPDGPGSVLENNVITEKTKVRVALADSTFDVREYPFRDLAARAQTTPEKPAAGDEASDAADGEPREKPEGGDASPRPERPARNASRQNSGGRNARRPRPARQNGDGQGRSPAGEATRPVTEGQRPAPEGKQSAPEGQRPAPEGKQPAPEGQRPAPEGKQPAPEGKQPAPEGKQSAPEGKRDADGLEDS